MTAEGRQPELPAVSPGLAVEVGDIERQLGLLWEQSEAAKARASLVNLVIYSESPQAIEFNTPLLAEIAADHAFRALLVQARPDAPRSGVQAWITAHCHLRGAGQKEICSEQITFLLDGRAAGLLSSIVFSHLDSDLPLYLWWQGPLHPDPEPMLWSWVDRLLVDSNTWKSPSQQFGILAEIEGLGRGRCAIGDLTWTRLFHLRYAVAQIFDNPAARRRTDDVQHLSITHDPRHRLTALELLGWIASRLGWVLDTADGRPVFCTREGRTVGFRLNQEASDGSCVTAVEFDFGDATARVRRDKDADFYRIDFEAPGSPPFRRMLPAGRENTADILLSELSRASRHPLFWPAIRAIEPLLHAEA